MADRSSHRARVLRYGEQAERRDDQLAAEEPLDLRLNGESLTVMMQPPDMSANWRWASAKAKASSVPRRT